MSDAISGSNTKPSAVPPPLTTVAWDGTGRRGFVERGGVGGDAVIDYPITIVWGKESQDV